MLKNLDRLDVEGRLFIGFDAIILFHGKWNVLKVIAISLNWEKSVPWELLYVNWTNEGPFLFLICFFVNKFPLLLPFSPYGEWCDIFLVQIGRTLTVCHCVVVVIITFLVQIWTNNLLKKVLAFPTFSSRKLMNHFKCYAVARLQLFDTFNKFLTLYFLPSKSS